MYVELYYHFLVIFDIEVMNMNIIEIFGTNVRFYRNKLKISQEKLGELSDLHRTYISDIETFKRSISLTNIEKIAQALQIEPYQLFIKKKVSKNVK
mgnify:CR=1 FL=1